MTKDYVLGVTREEYERLGLQHALDPDPLHDFDGLTYRRDQGAILDRLTAGASAA